MMAEVNAEAMMQSLVDAHAEAMTQTLRILKQLEWKAMGLCPICGSHAPVVRRPPSHRPGCEMSAAIRSLSDALGPARRKNLLPAQGERMNACKVCCKETPFVNIDGICADCFQSRTFGVMKKAWSVIHRAEKELKTSDPRDAEIAQLTARAEKAEHTIEQHETLARIAMMAGDESKVRVLEHFIIDGANSCDEYPCPRCQATGHLRSALAEMGIKFSETDDGMFDLVDILKNGTRKEIDAARARAEKAEAELAQARSDNERWKRLVEGELSQVKSTIERLDKRVR